MAAAERVGADQADHLAVVEAHLVKYLLVKAVVWVSPAAGV
eukprot:SAG22_NODE_2363_length_2655_cov_2.789906_3_plen_41_part_00